MICRDAGDGSHASTSGTFLAACTMFEVGILFLFCNQTYFQQIWGVPSSSSTYSPVGDAAALKTQVYIA